MDVDMQEQGMSVQSAPALTSRHIFQGKSFLDLPRELRDQVYSYLPKALRSLVTRTRYAVDFKYTFPRSILLVNRQVHAEAAEYLYGSNWFYITVDRRSSLVPASLQALSQTSYRSLVRKFVLYVTVRQEPCATIDQLFRYNAVVLKTTLESLAKGPIIDNLQILFYDQYFATVGMHMRQPIMEAFSPLYGRVRKVDILLWHTADSPACPNAYSLKWKLESPYPTLFRSRSCTYEEEVMRQEAEKKQQISLFHLPREMRDQVYSYLLQPNKIDARNTKSALLYSFPSSLLLTCHQIRAEAQNYFYTHNVCGITLRRCEPKLSTCIPTAHTRLISQFRITIDPHPSDPRSLTKAQIETVCRDLAALPRIRVLEIHCLLPPLNLLNRHTFVPLDERIVSDTINMLKPFALLAPIVEEVRFGRFLDPTPESGNRRAYNFLKLVMGGARMRFTDSGGPYSPMLGT